MEGPRVSRRQALAAGVAAAGALALQRTAVAGARAAWSSHLDFSALADGDGWPGWTCPGVANLRRRGGSGLLEAGSDVFPCDPRPVAFAVDQRFVDGDVAAEFAATGAGAGVVIRRVGPREHYAAVYDDEQQALVLLRRFPEGVEELARARAPRADGPLRLRLRADDVHPTALTASIESGTTEPVTVTADDGTPALQRAGDPGALATARTLFPSEGPPVLPALGNLHLLPYGVQEGEPVMASPAGQAVLAEIRERSTAVLSSISVHASGRPGPTLASVVAATTGAPTARGAQVRVATDVPARVEIEVATRRSFRRSRRVRAGITGPFASTFAEATGARPGDELFWRARVRRRRRTVLGPARSFRVLPPAGSGTRTTLAIGSCASQFGPVFDVIAGRRPDVLIWQGDLNYPDTLGPLAQTVPGYAGIWRDFLANPKMAPILDRTMFAVQRDDHDFGLQDANAGNLVPWGLAPWEALMERRPYYRFSAGLADVWVLDQRLHKSDPAAPDTPAKTLLGTEQRDWLLRTLAASPAPFKVVCSPCTLAPLPANRRDGSWATGFTAERDGLLAHVRERVGGQTVFVTGDTHWTMAYDRDGLFEARPCPLAIPTPNDITVTQPQVAEDARRVPGVEYADDERGHVAFLEVSGSATTARLDLSLVREDGATAFRRRFEERRGRSANTPG